MESTFVNNQINDGWIPSCCFSISFLVLCKLIHCSGLTGAAVINVFSYTCAFPTMRSQNVSKQSVFNIWNEVTHMHLLLTTWWKRWSQRRCWLCCHWLPLISCPHWPHCVYWSRMQCSFLLEQKRRHQEAGSRGIFLSCVAQVQEKNIFFPVSGWEVNYRNAGKINQLYSNHFIPWVAPFPSCKDTVNKASDNK